jgi:hypothetical protein
LPPAPLEVERLEVGRLDRARGGQSWADALAPAREAREVVEADRPGEDDVRVVEERAVELDRRAALRLAERDVARRVRGVVVERADALDDERRQELRLLLARDPAVDARGEDDAQVVGRDAERDQAADEQVDGLRAPRRARRVRDDDQDGLAGADDLLERLRVDGVVNQRADLGVRQRPLVRRLRL